jgi:hypothetical protein
MRGEGGEGGKETQDTRPKTQDARCVTADNSFFLY